MALKYLYQFIHRVKNTFIGIGLHIRFHNNVRSPYRFAISSSLPVFLHLHDQRRFFILAALPHVGHFQVELLTKEVIMSIEGTKLH